MTSPYLQPEYVTVDRFGTFEVLNDERFHKIERHFKEQKKYMDDGFEGMSKMIEHVESSMNEGFFRVNGRLDILQVKVESIEGKLDILLRKA